jgi:hypothetical protein
MVTSAPAPGCALGAVDGTGTDVVVVDTASDVAVPDWIVLEVAGGPAVEVVSSPSVVPVDPHPPASNTIKAAKDALVLKDCPISPGPDSTACGRLEVGPRWSRVDAAFDRGVDLGQIREARPGEDVGECLMSIGHRIVHRTKGPIARSTAKDASRDRERPFGGVDYGEHIQLMGGSRKSVAAVGSGTRVENPRRDEIGQDLLQETRRNVHRDGNLTRLARLPIAVPRQIYRRSDCVVAAPSQSHVHTTPLAPPVAIAV